MVTSVNEVTEAIDRALLAVLEGDVRGIEPISSSSQDQLEAAASRKQLILGRDAVVRVLHDYESGRVNATIAQRWASFVRWGLVVGRRGPIRPLDIEREPDCEDAIADAIARLDELGDIVDGTLEKREIKRLIDALTRS
jgi:hypothetical protein